MTRRPHPSNPKVVVIGAGVVGAAIADELVLAGWTNVTVVDQGQLPMPGGSSSHAPGLVFQTNPSKTMAGFAQRTVEKFSELGCFAGVGGLEVATTPERMDDLKRRHGWATSWGLETRLVDPDECVAMHPLLDGDAIVGGFAIPTDGLASATGAVKAQLDRAAEGGATLLGSTQVLDILHTDGRVTGVRTDADDLPADVVISATGFWGRRTGDMVGLRTPLLPMAHQYVRSTPLPALAGATAEATRPILRHQDRDLYMREHHDRLGVGSYAHRPMPVDLADLPAGEMPSVLAFTPEDFAPSWVAAGELLPILRGADVDQGMNGVFSFTPDGMPLLGEHPDLDGYWVAEAVWVTHSAGVGRTVARWLVDGEPDVDVHACELARFEAVEFDRDLVATRSAQSFVEVYDVLHPHDPPVVGRPLRVSPFHVRQVELGAVFDVRGGWERPLWFEANATLPEVADVPARGAWESRNFSPIAGAEALVTRERVAMFDMSPLGRVEVTGPGALDLLQGLTSNDVDKPIGTVVYTLALEPSGGVRSDLTVARLGTERFLVGIGSAVDVDRFRRAARQRDDDGRSGADVREVTAGTCGIGLWGPAARDVLSALTRDDISHEGFGYFTCRELVIAGVDVMALRMSYVGELGWELYTTADVGLHLWDALWAAGQPHGIIAAGRRAFESLRLEKGYRAAGTDLTTDHPPAASGVGFAVRPGKGDFVGRSAVVESADEPGPRLVPIVLRDPGRVVVGSEPVFHNGTCVGYVTSAAFGFAITASIAYAWLPDAVAVPGTTVEVEYFGERLAGTVETEPLFDPEMKKIRS